MKHGRQKGRKGEKKGRERERERKKREREKQRERAGLGRKVATRKTKKDKTFFLGRKKKKRKREITVALRCGRGRSRSNTSDNPLQDSRLGWIDLRQCRGGNEFLGLGKNVDCVAYPIDFFCSFVFFWGVHTLKTERL